MFTPVPMAKVAIVGPKTRLAETVETLHRLNLLHIEDYAAEDESFFELGSPLAHGSQLSERLLRLRGVMKGAQMAPPQEFRPFAIENLKRLEEKLHEWEEELAAQLEQRSKLLDEAKRIDETMGLLARVQNLALPTRLLTGYASLAVATGFIGRNADLDSLRSDSPHLEYVESLEEDGRFVAIFAPKDSEKPLQEALPKLGFQPLELPAADRTPSAERAALAERRKELQTRIDEFDQSIGSIRERHQAAFFALDEYLSIEADKAMAPVRFRASLNSFMVEGWIPHDAYARLERSLADATHNGVYVTRLERAARLASAPAHTTREHVEGHAEEAEPEESIPVMLKNPKPSGPYELLTDTYSRPKYRELDPTLFMYVGFPFFYGLMLGDIGYGLVLLGLVFGGVFNKLYELFGFQSRWHLNRIFVHASLSSILFGFVYAEFFGLELFGHAGIISHFQTNLGPFPYPLSRFENVKLLLGLCLLIAAVHLFIGLLLGLRNASIAHGSWEAIKHRGSWLAILLSVTLAGIALVPPMLGLGGIANALPLYVLALLFFVAGVILLVLGEGPTALLELPTIFSNLLSYTRLVAIGLSSVGIALAGNRVFALALDSGKPFAVVLGAFFLVFMHLVNVGLGVIGPALHSLRLHYVEFFTKFYEGGGLPYTPFGANRKFTTREVKNA